MRENTAQDAGAPEDIGALFDRARKLDLAGRDTDAQQAYLDVLARDMAHAGALNHLGALLSAAGYQGAARLSWQQAVERCPDDPAAYVRLGNLLRREGEAQDAQRHYEAALRRDPSLAEAHQGLALLCADQGAEDAAAWHRTRGFAPRALTSTLFRGTGTPVPVLRIVSCLGGNVPTELLLPDRVFLTHTIFAEYAARVPMLPPHAVVFNAIGDADLCREALVAAEALLAGGTAPVLNRPRAVRETGRADNVARLANIPGAIVPRVATLSRAELAGPDATEAVARAGLGFPLLLRAPGFHGGRHFVKADRPEDLPALFAELPGDSLMAIEYLDARGADDCVRKYRAMIVGGQLLPLHLAIAAPGAEHWKLHYFSADMAERPDHRAEEAAFLADMPRVIGPVAMGALAAIAGVLALDYAGVDFALAPDGRLMLFEANATMVVVLPADEPQWHYRREAARVVLEAARKMILSRAAEATQPRGRVRRPPLSAA